MTKGQLAAIQRAITRFENAVYEKAFQGTIPAGESEYAARCHDAIDTEYGRARRCLLALVEKYSA